MKLLGGNHSRRTTRRRANPVEPYPRQGAKPGLPLSLLGDFAPEPSLLLWTKWLRGRGADDGTKGRSRPYVKPACGSGQRRHGAAHDGHKGPLSSHSAPGHLPGASCRAPSSTVDLPSGQTKGEQPYKEDTAKQGLPPREDTHFRTALGRSDSSGPAALTPAPVTGATFHDGAGGRSGVRGRLLRGLC